MLLCVLGLVLIGLVMVYSASMVTALDSGVAASDYFTDQLIFAAVGVVMALVLWKVIPYRVWVGPIVWVIWGVAVALILATALSGHAEYGAQRWLSLGGFRIQPSEFCKIAFLLMAIRLLVDYRSGAVEFRASVVRAIIFIVVPLGVMYRTQSDLGTTVICAVGILAVMWLGGVPKKVILLIMGAGFLFGLYAIFGTGYRAGRMVFLNPWDDGEGGYGTGYNIIRSYYALSEGGIFGVGLGNSHEKFQYLFASESDFIFAVIGEELGLVGAMAVILLFFGVLLSGLSIAERSSDDIGSMIAGGCVVMLVFQAFLNIACVIGVFPTTGKPLPFISAGGSSMLSSFILLGLILSVSAAEPAPSIYEQRRADLRLVKQEGGSTARQSGRGSERSSSRGYRRSTASVRSARSLAFPSRR
ncbi:FtsW/RodA/SpoVE family cell cycle protein [Adlercreutzia equolifaciens]|uniref:FtsW/RodA/SpoVE family cell cycle protein n=1 Tax=Adlercreutzia equolifaciens TaxID=446660 RepID=UPI0023B0B75A|nr:FtsW/RodA/SpoVE family cell cycle protein [Adlercreutzia equolifaciens]